MGNLQMERTARTPRSTTSKIARKRRIRTSHKKSMVMMTGVLVLLVAVLGFHSISIRERGNMLRQQEEELQIMIQDQEKRAIEIAELGDFVHTDEHVRIVAEEVLGLVEPNVILFKPID